MHRQPRTAECVGDGVVGLVGVRVDDDLGTGVPEEQAQHGGLRLEDHRDADPGAAQESTVPELGGDRTRHRHRPAGPAQAGLGRGVVLGVAAGGDEEDVVGQHRHREDAGTGDRDRAEGVLVDGGEVPSGVDHDQGGSTWSVGLAFDDGRGVLG